MPSSLQGIGCIPRLPNPLGVVSPVIRPALAWNTWQPCDDNLRDQALAWGHEGMAQRWLVVYAPAARERAAATLTKATPRDRQASTTQRFHLHAQRFCAPSAAQAALAAWAQPWTYHRVDSYHLSAHQHDAGTGRPTPCTPLKALTWHIQAHVRSDDETIEHDTHVNAGFVLGTKIDAREWRHVEVLAADTGQSPVAGGFRLLQEPLCLVSSLLVKKPQRIAGRLMVMTLALLVYSVAQRWRRKPWALHHETVPNHINQPTPSPTVRGAFPLLEGMPRVQVTLQGQVHDLMEGLNDGQINIRRLFGHNVCRLDHIAAG